MVDSLVCMAMKCLIDILKRLLLALSACSEMRFVWGKLKPCPGRPPRPRKRKNNTRASHPLRRLHCASREPSRASRASETTKVGRSGPQSSPPPGRRTSGCGTLGMWDVGSSFKVTDPNTRPFCSWHFWKHRSGFQDRFSIRG